MRESDEVVGLDELFDPDEPGEELAPARPFGPRWWVRRILVAVAVTLLLWVVLLALRIGVPYVLVFVGILAVTVLHEVLRQVTADSLPSEVTGRGMAQTRDRPTGPLEQLRHSVGPTDGLRFAIGRWEDRLLWGERDTGRFAGLVVPRMAELVNERLRQRHGITLASAPEQARQLTGEELWNLLHSPSNPGRGRSLGPRDVASIVAKVEEL